MGRLAPVPSKAQGKARRAARAGPPGQAAQRRPAPCADPARRV